MLASLSNVRGTCAKKEEWHQRLIWKFEVQVVSHVWNFHLHLEKVISLVNRFIFRWVETINKLSICPKNQHDNGKSTMNEDVFPIENGIFQPVMLVFRGVFAWVYSRQHQPARGCVLFLSGHLFLFIAWGTNLSLAGMQEFSWGCWEQDVGAPVEEASPEVHATGYQWKTYSHWST